MDHLKKSFFGKNYECYKRLLKFFLWVCKSGSRSKWLRSIKLDFGIFEWNWNFEQKKMEGCFFKYSGSWGFNFHTLKNSQKILNCKDLFLWHKRLCNSRNWQEKNHFMQYTTFRKSFLMATFKIIEDYFSIALSNMKKSLEFHIFNFINLVNR